MHTIVRRYEGIDTKRTDELTRKVGESLTPPSRSSTASTVTTSSRPTTAS
jgi:hypothetical protein